MLAKTFAASGLVSSPWVVQEKRNEVSGTNEDNNIKKEEATLGEPSRGDEEESDGRSSHIWETTESVP